MTNNELLWLSQGFLGGILLVGLNIFLIVLERRRKV